MADKTTRIQPEPDPQNEQAPGEQTEGSTVSFMDLSAIPTHTRRMVDPLWSISYKSYVGQGSARGVEEIRSSAKGRRLSSPTPKRLIISQDKANPTTIYGVPTMKEEPPYLKLEWIDQSRVVRANFQAILKAKEIEIPAGTKMLIKIEHIKHPELGHCVKFSWDGDCFVPIETESKESDKQ